ncbi:unnamed protein product [Darwinula stevensoni]|uniref:CARD domain-containing protein n=1 Tax=Darwinula stevensoni TaxID=69355 RepID=A0A7R8XD41_9CRUS|nr:unnamed protein product [Darwinula stevensoni]CAG0894304.1 unnamed protein product [Darwinula stevensoni]
MEITPEMDANQRQRQIAAILAHHAEGLNFINVDGVLEDIRAADVIEHHEFFKIIRKDICFFQDKEALQHGDFPLLRKSQYEELTSSNSQGAAAKSRRATATASENSQSREKAALTPSNPQGAAGKPYRATTPASQYSEAQASNSDYMGEKAPSQIQISEDLKTWDKIRANRRKLRDEYNVDVEELLRCLSDRNVFTAHEEKQIRSKENPKLLYDELFEILLHKNPKKYAPVFLDALTVIGRQDVRDFLLSEVDKMPA